MEQNKTGKYLKYAIGEIALVVVGILIALQINNWNEDKIRHNDIKNSLSQILNDLQQDQENLNYYIEREIENVTILKGISLNNNSDNLETLLKSFDYYMAFTMNNNGYSGIKDSGKISNINDDVLKAKLTNYYEKVNNSLINAVHFAEKFTNDRVAPFVIKNLQPNIDLLVPKEVVLEKLKTSELKYLINYQISVKNYSIRHLKRGLESNLELISIIKKELEN